MIPLQHTILYSADSYPNRYWTAERNTTEWSIFMNEMVTAGNKIAELLLQQLPATHPDAHIGRSSLPTPRVRREPYCTRSPYPHICLTSPPLTLTQRMVLGLFDSHTLFTDILADPKKYLNGTEKPNTTSCIKSCVFQLNEDVNDTGNCTIATGKAVDSYMW